MVADIRDGRSSWVSYVYNGEGQAEMLTPRVSARATITATL